MYTPPAFRLEDCEVAVELAAANPFGLLVAPTVAAVEIVHLPMRVIRRNDAFLVIGHVARANPVVTAIRSGTVATAVFSGAHAYISPDWYAADDQVPTWNYLAVHLYGTLSEVSDGAALRALLAELTGPEEAALAPKPEWTHGKMPSALLERMLKGIVGFELRVERVEAKAKLSQNKGRADREGAIAALEARGDPGSRETAAWMRRLAPS